MVAADAASATELVDLPVPSFKATVTAYFAAEEAPTGEPLLILDGERAGPANHVAVMSNVAPAYAPPGAHLISVSGIDRAAEDPARFRVAALEQLSRWFGPSVFKWRHLETYLVPHALPRHPAGSLRGRPPVKRADGVVMAGDYTEFGAIQGALLSGRRAAGAILRDR